MNTMQKNIDEKFCSECASVIKAKAVICVNCGCSQSSGSQAGAGSTLVSEKNRIVAALFAFFLGWMGMHKFYLGDAKTGIFYLLFCWTGIPMLFAFFESIFYLCMSDETFHSKHCIG